MRPLTGRTFRQRRAAATQRPRWLAAFALLAAAPAGAQTDAAEVSFSVGDDDRVRIEVPSAADRYHVLYYRSDPEDAATERAVAIHMGKAGKVELSEPMRVGSAGAYRVATHLKAAPADTDGDGVDDVAELGRAALGLRAPLNRASPLDRKGTAIDIEVGAVGIPDLATFKRLSRLTDDAPWEPHLDGLEYVKYTIADADTDDARIWFQNTDDICCHHKFMRSLAGWSSFAVFNKRHMRGILVYHPYLVAPNGAVGTFRFEYQPQDSQPFARVARSMELLAANMPFLRNNLVYYPMPGAGAVSLYKKEKALYDGSRVPVYLDEDISDAVFLPLNAAVGYGRLGVFHPGERPTFRDVVILPGLPNELSTVAGIITVDRQTPLSHVNLRAVQDGVPNAYVGNALEDETIAPLLGKYVRYQVTSGTGAAWSLTEATAADVATHHAARRPASTQTPARDLTVTAYADLDDIAFADADTYGAKATNLAELRDLTLADVEVPDGYALPFHFYDEFMKHNSLYATVDTLLADEDFQADIDERDARLTRLRRSIRDGDFPDALRTKIGELQGEFPDTTSIRCRSSTNNEDLPAFNGAGLYDSFTHHPDEGHLEKSIKQVFASLWNLRAFEAREFHRVDHKAAAMGVLLHPNFSDEKANGVAASENVFITFGGPADAYYVNAQLGEELVTNPDGHLPEELLLTKDTDFTVSVVRRSSLAKNGAAVLSDAHVATLHAALGTIDARFRTLNSVAEDAEFAIEIEFKVTAANAVAIKQARPWVY